DVVNLFAQRAGQGFLTQTCVDLFASRFTVQLQVKDSHGNVRGWNANGITREFARELWKRFGNRGCCTGFGDHHVHASGTATAGSLVEVVDQVLVVGVGVHGFNVTVVDAVLVVDDFQNRGNRIGSTGSSRDDGVFRGDVVGVDTEDNILQVALTRSGQHDLGSALGLEVLAQTFFIAPYTSVVHNNGVIDAVFGVVEGGWVRCVDDLDLGAISRDGIGFFINFNGAVKRTMHRVAAQQGGTLDDVVI